MGNFNLGDPSSWNAANLGEAGAIAGGVIAGPLGAALGAGQGATAGAGAGAVNGQGLGTVGVNGDPLSAVGNALGLGKAPGTDAYQVDQSAFQNPYGNAAPALNSTLGSYVGSSYKPVTAATSPYTSQAGAGLGGLAGQYAAMAAGQGPSLATVQAQQQGQQNLAATESMLGSARGAGNPAAAQLAAQGAAASGQQQVAQNAVLGRTNEEMGALSGLGSTYGALGGLGTTVQGQGNQVGMGNQAALQAAYQQKLQALMAENAQQQQGAMAGQQLGAQNALGYANLSSNNYNNQAGRVSNLLGAGLGAGASFAKVAGA